MRSEITIRSANPEDLRGLQALVERAYGPYRDTIGVEPGPLHDDYELYIAKNYAQVLTAENRIIALLILIPKAEALLVDNVAIDPDWQGRGLGRDLLTIAEQAGLKGGYSCLRLYTHEKMSANISLYKHLGFVETARVFERGLNRVYMEKPLPDPRPDS